MEKEEMLKRLNKFTRWKVSEDEVYIFDVILGDNDIDRDGERFSQNALESLKKLFVGKTGILDCGPKSKGQTARIFSTEIVTDNTKTTKNGEPYTCLKGKAYMVRTDSNSGLIREIDGGAKKEVSISCSAGSKKCSVCGTDLKKQRCSHVTGKKYGEKIAHAVLDDIGDAYEWNFVTLPAINIETVDVFGWESAIRGMRNPMNSWDKSDSSFINTGYQTEYSIGPNDLKLMKSLVKAGTDHRKFLRMINVTMDITAPLYWWKEFDTYKVGTVRNSCSTMHKIHEKAFTLGDFSHGHLMDGEVYAYPLGGGWRALSPIDTLQATIELLNNARRMYLETENEKYWWQMIQLLPSSYNQRATVQLNYEVLFNIYHSRRNHKLDEWRKFCEQIETLPYSEIII